MRPSLLADTGLIVAFLSANDRDHEWADAQFRAGPLPFLTCDAVLTEATYLLARDRLSREHVIELVAQKVLVSAFDVNAEAAAVAGLMARYHDVPMDFADACLVRMAELYPRTSILTLDSDFAIYRKNGSEVISVIGP